ncbi:MAG: glutamine-hydrolyzing GMP synthase [Lentisphaeria bacterium]|nr:glutamine-hydrolyzing GMP synthase [Lentisphaeria bacterium]NQZ67658.1 glutamine-hydrolyzing GMP synthase [Lentisphaeria bacterium]
MDTSNEKILILDFGSQYTQLIARRIRECHIYSIIIPFSTPIEEIEKENPKGIILSGGPSSVYEDGAPHCDERIFDLGIPILGICYGLQLTVKHLNGNVEKSEEREYGHAVLNVKNDCPLFSDIKGELNVWMSHGDKVHALPDGFEVIGQTENCEYAAIQNTEMNIYGLQFHPEVAHTEQGLEILKNFCINICSCSGDWTMESFIESTIADIRQTVGTDTVILGLSGGVDSSVSAALLQKAIGDQLVCIFVNNGLLRMGEAESVLKLYGDNFKMNLVYVDATDQFLDKLANVTDPETKRKIIGHEFVNVFDEESSKIDDAKFLAQGTTYPDVIESVPISGNPSALIKSHHNVGGLPEDMKLKLVEPLAQLFKDEVREVGAKLGLPKEVVWRQPFPGPGLGVRIIGDVTREKIHTLQLADRIVIEEMKAADYYYKVWQAFAVFLPVQSVGVMGDQRTYENAVALRVVTSQDGMTADWAKLPYDLLGRISNRIINEVRGINRVCYDISSKPPGTIEWE